MMNIHALVNATGDQTASKIWTKKSCNLFASFIDDNLDKIPVYIPQPTSEMAFEQQKREKNCIIDWPERSELNRNLYLPH